jgi:hypothetical protein
MACFRCSREKVGELLPVLVNKQGWVIDGRHRLAAYKDWKREVLDLDEVHSLLVRIVANTRDDTDEHRIDVYLDFVEHLRRHEPGNKTYTVASGKTIAERIKEETGIAIDESIRYLDRAYLHAQERERKRTLELRILCVKPGCSVARFVLSLGSATRSNNS